MHHKQVRAALAGSAVIACALISVPSTQAAPIAQRQIRPMAEHRLSADDRKFIKETAQDQLGDIAMGRLAERRGLSAGVRDYGRRQVADHTRTYRDLVRTSARLGYAPPSRPGPEQREMERELRRYRGLAFDQEYRRDMVKDHRKDVSDFTRQVRTSESPAVRDYARRTLTVLREHLQMAIALGPGTKAYAHRYHQGRVR